MSLRLYTGSLVIVGLLGALPAFTNLRVGSLQPEDFVLLLLLGFCIAKFIYSGFSFRLSSQLIGLFMSYGLLLLSLLLLSVLATRLTFYPLDEVSILKRPVIFSLSKLLQLAAIICGFLWLANVFVRKRDLLAQAMSIYYWTGIVSSQYAILSYLALARLHFTPPEIFGAYSNIDGGLRACGFFNEGGPFGVYIVSVVVVGLLHRRVTGQRLGVVSIAVLSIAFLLSASKAGFVAAAPLCLYSIISAASFRRRASYLILSSAILWAAAAGLSLGDQLLGYLESYQNIDEQIAVRGNDYSLVVGRVSALYIVPRMISAHPLTGIGFGNYPLMRNDPLYLGSLPAITEVEDLPGLGIPGIAAEMGIPVTLWLMLLLFRPYWGTRKKALVFAMAALFQPLAHIVVGVQLTLFYPWFVTACALAASCDEPDRSHLKR
jgi:O-Antigen ligase